MEYKILSLWAYYETTKFTWDQSGWLGKLEYWDFEQANEVAYCSEGRNIFSVVVEEGSVSASLII